MLCLVMLSLLTLSCNRADMEEGHIGKSGFLVTLTDDVRVESRSTPAELKDPLNTDFDLKIIRTSTGETVYDGKFKEDLIQASAGFYQVTASFGTNPVLAVDAPYYEGTVTEVEVRKDTPAQVLVPCKVANALLSVVYGESIAKVYDSYYVTVAVGEKSREIRDNESAYFRASSIVNVWFHGTPKGESEERTFELLHEKLTTPLEAGDHAILNLSIEAGVNVSVEKLEVKTTTVSETIPVEYMPKPKLEAEGFSNNELTFAETEKKAASVHLKLASPLQELKMRFHFEDAQFASLNNQDYLLSKDKAALENALGIILPDVNAPDATIDFSNLIAKMQTNAGATTRNVIELDAQANNRWSSESMDIEEQNSQNKAFTLICNKPEFSVVVEDKNCWSREFTINEVNVTAGDAETIKKNLVYQYFDGSDWKECSTRESVKGRTQQFIQRAEEISSKVYKVRALYRGVIASAEAEATLETPEQLPNSGMDEWNVETYIKEGGLFSRDETYYSFNPWQNDEDHFWDTCNDFTTRHRNNSNVNIYKYNGFHAVSYVPGRNGLAAELRSTANGRGNMVATFYDFNKVAGELFTGTAKVTMGTSGVFGDADGSKDIYEREKDASFYNRPTALKFWYKYVPYNSDTWKVHVELLDENRNVIIQNDYTSSEIKNDWTETTLPLNYVEGVSYAKCKYIYVIFSSTINAGANMPYREITQTFYIDNGNSSLTFSPAYVGSVLTIDDISLVYDK